MACQVPLTPVEENEDSDTCRADHGHHHGPKNVDDFKDDDLPRMAFHAHHSLQQLIHKPSTFIS